MWVVNHCLILRGSFGVNLQINLHPPSPVTENNPEINLLTYC